MFVCFLFFSFLKTLLLHVLTGKCEFGLWGRWHSRGRLHCTDLYKLALCICVTCLCICVLFLCICVNCLCICVPWFCFWVSFYCCVVNTGDSWEAPLHCTNAKSSYKFCIECDCCLLCISWQTHPCICCVQEAPCWCGIVPYLWGAGWPWIKFCWPQEKNSLPHFDFHPPQVKINQVFIGLKWENFFLCKVSQYDFF